jgi:hypothetical protein
MRTKQRLLIPSLLVAGMLMLLVGFAWDRFVPVRTYWSDDQAREYTQAQSALHAVHGNSHGHDQEVKLNAARDRFVQIHQQLEEARGGRRRSAFLLKVAGISLLVAGLVTLVVANQSD